MIITRTSRPFGRSAPQFTAGDVVKGISRLVRSETAKTFSFGYGQRRQMCSGISVVTANDGTDCGDGGGQPVCVARSEGRTFEIPCQLGSGGSGGGLTTTLGRRSFYSGKVFVFRDSACATIRVYSMVGAYLGTWKYLTGGVYVCQAEDRLAYAYWAKEDPGDPSSWFPKTGYPTFPGENVPVPRVTPYMSIGYPWLEIRDPLLAGQHREATQLGDAPVLVANIGRRAGIETYFWDDMATRPDLRYPPTEARDALGPYGSGGSYTDPDFVMVGRYIGDALTTGDPNPMAVLPAGITDTNGDIVADPDGTIWVHAISETAARVTLTQYSVTDPSDPAVQLSTVSVSLGAGMFLDSIQTI